jgi:hypothetical protein
MSLEKDMHYYQTLRRRESRCWQSRQLEADLQTVENLLLTTVAGASKKRDTRLAAAVNQLQAEGNSAWHELLQIYAQLQRKAAQQQRLLTKIREKLAAQQAKLTLVVPAGARVSFNPSRTRAQVVVVRDGKSYTRHLHWNGSTWTGTAPLAEKVNIKYVLEG